MLASLPLSALDLRFQQATEGRYEAHSAVHGFRAAIGADGVRLSAARGAAGWALHVATVAVGRDGGLQLVAAGQVQGGEERVELVRDALVEWFAHGTRGLEQGWDVLARPGGPGPAPLAVHVRFDGLRPVARGEGVLLVDEQGRPRLSYSEAKAWDAHGSGLVTRLVVRGATVAVEVEDAGAHYPVTIDPLISGPHQTLVGPQPGSRFGSGLSSAGDVNGDGFCDLLVGASRFDGAFTDEGRVYLFRGTPSGFAADPAWTHLGGQADARLGEHVGFAGDVNGDGYSDIVVAAPRYDVGGLVDAGTLRLFHGSPSGPSTSADWTLDGFHAGLFLGAASTAGDVNGDGYDDLVVGAALYDGAFANEGLARLYLGSATGLGTVPAWEATGGVSGARFGSAVSAGGDVDGDGHDDVVVGAPGAAGGDGEAHLFAGTPAGLETSPLWTGRGLKGDDEFGTAVDTAGDYDGDSLADILVGAPNAPITYYSGRGGLVYVFLGRPTGPSTSPSETFYGSTFGERFGQSVATAGDVNGDGYEDFVAGAPLSGLGGRVELELGTPGTFTDTLWTARAVAAGEEFGANVTGIGDVDADGFGDVAAAAPGADLVRVFLGGGEPFQDEQRGVSTEGTQIGETLGASVAGVGDVDGDGLDEVLLGAPGYDGTFVDEGRALLNDLTGWSVQGGQEGARAGEAVAGARDVDGDGYDDVLVGSPSWDGAHADEGRVQLFLGSPGGLASSPAWQATGGEPGALLGAAVTSVGDVNGDGFADFAVGAPGSSASQPGAGRADVYLGSPSGPSTLPVRTYLGDQAGGGLGDAVAGAGDVDGDGYDDVLVAASEYDLTGADAGLVQLYLGGPAGPAALPAWSDSTDEAGALFGAGVGGVGDVNGDGHDDIVVGAPGSSPGVSYIYYGSAAGPGSRTLVQEDFSSLGISCDSAGDVNNDGFADVLVGAPPHGAFVHYGTPTGLSGTSSNLLVGRSTTKAAGTAVASAGDRNGDSFADALLGDPRFQNAGFTGRFDQGLVALYDANYSNPKPLGARLFRPRQLQPATETPIGWGGRAASPDTFLVRVELGTHPAGFLWAAPGPVTATLEVEVKPIGVPFDGQTTQLSAPLTVSAGVPLVLELLAKRTGALRQPHRWRARVHFDGNPLQQRSHWVFDRGTSWNDAMLRFQELRHEAPAPIPR